MEDAGTDKVKITVQSIEGECQACHEVGQEIIVDGINLSGYICPHAMMSLWPFVLVLHNRGKFPWDDGDSTIIACPDGTNLVRFEIHRIRE